jgi:hypothetical protein
MIFLAEEKLKQLWEKFISLFRILMKIESRILVVLPSVTLQL